MQYVSDPLQIATHRCSFDSNNRVFSKNDRPCVDVENGFSPYQFSDGRPVVSACNRTETVGGTRCDDIEEVYPTKRSKPLDVIASIQY